MIFYFTFGQIHVHPFTGTPMRDYWVEIEAENYDRAREIMIDVFGTKWAMMYTIEDFDPSYYPNGCHTRLIDNLGDSDAEIDRQSNS